MQTNQKNRPALWFTKLGFAGIGLCALCCALPIVGTLAGISAFSLLAVYLEKIGLALLIASVGLLALAMLRKRARSTQSASCTSGSDTQGQSCSVDCTCQDGTTTASVNQTNPESAR
jgi:hypothetical protein